MNGRNVSRIMFAPDREDCLRAVSKAMLAVRNLEGATLPKIGDTIGCDADNVATASNGENLISFDTIAALLCHFPDQCAPIFALWGRERDELTADDHEAAIAHHSAALRRMVGEARV